MSGYRGYNNYRGRTSKGKTVLTVVLILIILASIGFMLLQKYVVYDAAGTPHLMLPGRETTEPVLPEEGEEELNLTISPSEQKAFVSRSFSVTEALTMESWRQAWTEAPKGCNAVTADMKVSGSGKLFFDAKEMAGGARATKNDTPAALMEMLQGDTAVGYAVARLSCFHDSIAARWAVEDMGLKNTGGYIFYDGNNTQWLDPAKEGARKYLCGMAVELAELGFDEILLTDVSYPTEGKLDKIDYGDTVKARNLQTFLEEMRAALEPYEVKLSLELSEAVLIEGSDNAAGIIAVDLIPLADRLYVETDAGSVEELRSVMARLDETVEFVPVLSPDSELPEEGSFLLR